MGRIFYWGEIFKNGFDSILALNEVWGEEERYVVEMGMGKNYLPALLECFSKLSMCNKGCQVPFILWHKNGFHKARSTKTKESRKIQNHPPTTVIFTPLTTRNGLLIKFQVVKRKERPNQSTNNEKAKHYIVREGVTSI